MAHKGGRTAAILVLIVAATVGMADLLRSPSQPLRFDKARAGDLLDPDAPIATARYREPTDAQLAAVGLMRIPDAPPKPVQVARIDDPPAVAPYDMARLIPPQPDSIQETRVEAVSEPLVPPDPEALAAAPETGERRAALAASQAQSPGRSLSARGEALLERVAPTESDRRRGRWFLFAAASETAFGLNYVRDEALGQMRRAGWSVERLARYGEAQIGVGWRKYGGQVSLAVARREIGDARVRVRDFVAGINWSWRPHDT